MGKREKKPPPPPPPPFFAVYKATSTFPSKLRFHFMTNKSEPPDRPLHYQTPTNETLFSFPFLKGDQSGKKKGKQGELLRKLKGSRKERERDFF